jgi:alkanesulfonate monooxygenase SsuD/methylene tetrahydromethanopterin reductase-like flavin-dependent oxidoreductase (luciferase family)
MLANGRNPDSSKILFLVSPIIGRDDEEAHARDAENKKWWRDNVERQLAGLAYNMNIDFSKLDVDAPIPASFTTEGHQGTLNNLRGDGTQTLRERLGAYTVWESVDLVGSPATVAAKMAEVMQEVGGDGFLLSNPFPTRRYIDEIVDGLVPELQARGLSRKTYEHTTFRDNLLAF